MKKISEIPEKNPFRVPENYFEEVNRKILSVTRAKNQAVTRTGFYYRFRTQIAIAASVAGFLLISYSAVKLLTPDKSIIHFTEFFNEENSYLYFDNIDLLALEENAASLNLCIDEQEVTGNDIISYLLSENIEIIDIYEQI